MICQRECAEWACSGFVIDINRDDVCRLASLFNYGRPRHVSGEPKKVSFNVCSEVIFASPPSQANPGTAEPERWITRFPMLACLAYTEEKLRGEIATMK